MKLRYISFETYLHFFKILVRLAHRARKACPATLLSPCNGEHTTKLWYSIKKQSTRIEFVKMLYIIWDSKALINQWMLYITSKCYELSPNQKFLKYQHRLVAVQWHRYRQTKQLLPSCLILSESSHLTVKIWIKVGENMQETYHTPRCVPLGSILQVQLSNTHAILKLLF